MPSPDAQFVIEKPHNFALEFEASQVQNALRPPENNKISFDLLGPPRVKRYVDGPSCFRLEPNC